MKKKIFNVMSLFGIVALLALNASVVLDDDASTYLKWGAISKVFATDSGSGSGSGSDEGCWWDNFVGWVCSLDDIYTKSEPVCTIYENEYDWAGNIIRTVEYPGHYVSCETDGNEDCDETDCERD